MGAAGLSLASARSAAWDRLGFTKGAIVIASPLRYAKNVGWLLVPVIVWNAVLASRLPDFYLPAVFHADIPAALSIAENLLRVLVFALPFLAPFELVERAQTYGLALFAVGLAIYFAGWLPLIADPRSAWSRSAVGLIAPAYTPAVWLAGLVLLVRRLHWASPYRRWHYAVVVGAFVTAHVGHALLVFAR